MPRAHKYKRKEGYYIRTTVKSRPITIRLTDNGVKSLGLSGQSKDIDWEDLKRLLANGDAYTGGSGPGDVLPPTVKPSVPLYTRATAPFYIPPSTPCSPFTDYAHDTRQIREAIPHAQSNACSPFTDFAPPQSHETSAGWVAIPAPSRQVTDFRPDTPEESPHDTSRKGWLGYSSNEAAVSDNVSPSPKSLSAEVAGSSHGDQKGGAWSTPLRNHVDRPAIHHLRADEIVATIIGVVYTTTSCIGKILTRILHFLAMDVCRMAIWLWLLVAVGVLAPIILMVKAIAK